MRERESLTLTWMAIIENDGLHGLAITLPDARLDAGNILRKRNRYDLEFSIFEKFSKLWNWISTDIPRVSELISRFLSVSVGANLSRKTHWRLPLRFQRQQIFNF